MESLRAGDQRWRFTVVARTHAPIDKVWPLVAEAERWKHWSFLTRSFLISEGWPIADGVGALRRLAVGPFGSTEEVVIFEPPRHLGYVAHKGLPVRSYQADIVLENETGGTLITWAGRLAPLIPGTGALSLAYVRSFVRRLARELARHADYMVRARSDLS